MSKSEIPLFETPPPSEFDVEGTTIHVRLMDDKDAENLYELATEKSVQTYVPWAKFIHDIDSARETLSRFRNAWERGVMARYAVEKDSEFVGYCGLWRDKIPDYYEFGFAILPEYRGQSIGTATINRLIEIAKSKMHAKGIVAYVDDSNEPSKAVVTKLKLEPTSEFDDGDRRYILHFANTD